jgi:hypothetical protein
MLPLSHQRKLSLCPGLSLGSKNSENELLVFLIWKNLQVADTLSEGIFPL